MYLIHKMKSFFVFCFALVAAALVALPAQAQPVTTIVPTTDTDELVQQLLGPSGSITVTDVEYTGADGAIGTFTDGPLGMPSGIAISSGLVSEMSYREPKTDPSTTMGSPGDPLCDQLTDPGTSSDAAVLRIVFDLADDVDGILFDHVVGTQEYPDYLGAGFNDGFGVFLNGQNIALSVNDEPVTVNSFFTSDEVIEHPDNEMNFNAGTPLFSSRSDLAGPGSTDNELIIVVCDAGDTLFDTGGFVSLFDACFGDCDGTSQCGDGILQGGEQCDGEDIDPSLSECPDGYSGTPLCNNDPVNPDGDGSCRIDPIPDGCTDINECDEDPTICGDATCVNNPGGYTCECDDGYEFDGTSCVNIDECADSDLNDCDENATCADEEGSYTCECNDGYSGTGESCDVDIILVSPAEGSITNDPRTTIGGTGEPDATVTIGVDGQSIGATTIDGDGNWSYTPDEDLPEGVITIEATDGISADSVTIEIDTSPATLVVVEPQGLINDSQPTASGTADPNATIVIETEDDTYIITADADGNWSFTSPEELTDGEYQWEVTATNPAGTSTTDTADFEIDTIPPALTLLTPNGSTADATPEFTGTADPDAEVTIATEDGPVTVTADGDGNWSYTPATPLDDGEYQWDVSTTDEAGNITTETADFEIDTAPPLLTVTGPDSATNDPTPTVTGTSEPGATITIDTGEDTITVTSDGDGNWSWTPEEPLDDGTYEWEASTTNDLGTEATAPVEFEVDTVAPMIQVRVPEDGDVFSETPDAIEGDSEAFAQIVIFIDGDELGTTTADEDGEWFYELDDPLDDGEYEATAQAIDEAGNLSEDSVSFIIDTTVLLVILQPEEGDIVRNSTPTITGEAEPDSEVEIIIDDEVVAVVTTDADGQWSWTPEEDFSDGELTVTAFSDSAAGDREDTVIFTIDTSTTEVAITSPSDGELVDDSSPVFTGNAEPGATVTIYVDGEEVATVEAGENGNWSWTPEEDLPEGNATITVVADDDGIESEDSVTITIDTIPPSLVVSSPEEDETVPAEDATVTGTAEPGATIVVTVDGEPVGSTTADEDGNWSVPLPDDLDDGEKDIRVTATDEAGNTSVVERRFIIEADDGGGEGDGEIPGDGDVELGSITGGGPACSSTSNSGTGGLLLLALLAMMALRPRRETNESTINYPAQHPGGP